MLYLIGLGICDENDMSIRGIEACRNADFVYAELYTLKWNGNVERLKKIIGKNIELLERKDAEDGMEKIIEKAEIGNIALLVPGDPLVATTHINFLYECRKRGIVVEVIHSSSIYTAVAESGLQIYKFGRTVSIAEPQDGYFPTSFYDYISENRRAGLHTLILLDINMDAGKAFKILLDVEKKKNAGLFSQETEIIACSRIGCSNKKIIYGKIRDLEKISLQAPCVIILPGNLHITEKEYLDLIKIK